MTMERPEKMLIVPSVAMRGLSFSRVTMKPLSTPTAQPMTSAVRQPAQILMPLACISATMTPARPATAATDRSSPPPMISGVPAAAIRPMKAMLVPMLDRLLSVRK
jgi:hypothetical protein